MGELYMGLRFWIKTEKEPVFNYQIQWMRLNEQAEDGYWFFQDEFDDCGLHRVLGYTYECNPKENRKLIREYKKNPYGLLFRMSRCTPHEIEQHFNSSWTRPVPYWEQFRAMTIYYMTVKQQYIRALLDANIVDIINMNREVGGPDVAQWYQYREYQPFIFYDKICGKISNTGHR